MPSESERLETRFLPKNLVSSLPMGLSCAAAGVLVGWYAVHGATGEGYEVLPLYAGLAAFLTGSALWWAMIARPGKRSALRGALAGALTGIISHYGCWYLIVLSFNLCYRATGGCRGSLGDSPSDPLNGLWGAAVLSAGSLFFFGWLTAPLGALIGALLGVWPGIRHQGIR